MNIICSQPEFALDQETADRLEQAVYEGEGQVLRVNLHVVDDGEMARLHAQHLGQAETTDVLAFDTSGEGPGEDCDEDVDGEVVVNGDMAGREARDRGHARETELLFYVAHGLLHLLGYDDDSPEKREAMHVRQAAYLAQVGHTLETRET